MAFAEITENGIVYMASDIIGAKHGFMTRRGGVSTGIFESLNVGSNIGDPQENVSENYGRICRLFGVGVNGAAVTKQVHGNKVRIVEEEDRHECGSRTPYEADGIVTACKGLPLFCFTADCVPVLLWEPEAGVCGAVHCGWRGSAADIIGNAVNAMGTLGAKPENIRAAIGPAIGACCFETHSDVPDALYDWIKTDEFTRPKGGGKYLVDLRGANAFRLRQLGIRDENIDISGECTSCSHDKYWSHRYTGGKRGVQCAVIVL